MEQDANYSRKRVKKHTLDSDEEDDVEKVKTLKNDDIEGQEEGTVDFEEGIKFTPFHMKNEMEEGDFDENGMYLFNKDKDAIKDAWSDNIEWSREDIEKTLQAKERKLAREKLVAKEADMDEASLIKSMLTVMQPKETVTKVMKRLNESGGAVKGWQKKKAKSNSESEEESKARIEKVQKQLSDFIGWADRLLSKGMFNIYQETYESLSYKLSQMSKTTAAVDELDIFGSGDPKPVEEKPVPELIISDDVEWEFKWSNETGEKVYGPYKSQQMLQWQDEGYFKEGVYVRKLTEVDKDFYSSRRVDFGLYL